MIFGSVYDSISESTLGDVAPYEFDESMSFQEMGAQMIEEATQDWNNYMQAVALTELSYVIENHQEYIYEAVDISAMINKVKEWFKKLWAKIQGIAKAAIAKFMSFGKNDEGFINKYEKDIYNGADRIPSGFSYKGYTFKGLAGKSKTIKDAAKGVSDSAAFKTGFYKQASASGKDRDNNMDSTKHLDKQLSQYRATLVHKNGEVSQSEFKKEMKIDLYGSADKQYIKEANASDLIGIVKGAKEAINAAKEAESAIKEDIDGKISDLNDLESEIRGRETAPEDTETRKRNNSYATVVSNYSSYLQKIGDTNSMWFSTYINALKDQNRQAKAICTKLISFANGVGGKKSTNESASLLEGRFQELLDF